ncbi:MAG TPA: hypothetical protein DCG49_00330 [Ruminococcus sp.]|nr:hypothetical protein [Ruminococcus sp.]
MIKKLRLRYLITNMALLSSTLLVCLTVLFGVLYHAEVSSSYTVMREMMKRADQPGQHGEPPNLNAPTIRQDEPILMPLSENPDENQWQYPDNNNMPPVVYPPPWGWWYPWWIPNPGDGNQPDWGEWDWNNPPNNDEPHDDHNDNRDAHEHDDRNNHPEQPIETQPPKIDPPAETQPPHQTQPPAPPATKATAPPNRIEHPTEPQQPPEPVAPDVPETEPPQTEPVTETQTATATTPITTQPATTAAANRTAPKTDKNTATETVPPPEPIVPAPESPQSDFPEPGEPPVVPVEEGKYVPDALIAQLDSDGNIESYAGNDSHKSDDEHFQTVHRAIQEVKHRGKRSGTIKIDDVSYRFLYEPDENGHYNLVLIDRTPELSALSRLLFIFILITAFGLMIVFGISLLLANWTVTPIAVAWEKQKQFVADASHELKTPLAVIAANTEVILSNPQESVSGQSKWLSYIQSETTRMSKLISNLLSVARMDSGKAKQEQIEALSLSDTVANVCLVFEPIIYENGKTLQTSIAENVMMPAEEDNIKQLLSILLDNAVLHSVPNAEISVTLAQDAQDQIRLSVANTAKDIPEEQLSHLFERFYRVDTEGSPNGSGLGLSIAKSIVKQLHGELTVTSAHQLVTFTAVFRT